MSDMIGMRDVATIIQDRQPVVFLGSSTGMHNQIEICRARGREVLGIVDADYDGQSQLHGLPILKFDDLDVSKLCFFVATFWSPFQGAVFERNNAKRKDLLQFMRQHQLTEATLIHPTAVVSPGARIGSNVSVGALSVISHGAQIAHDVIVREQCFVGHDVEIGANSVLQTKSNVTSQVKIEPDCYIGINATLVNGQPLDIITIPAGSVIYPSELCHSQDKIGRRRRLGPQESKGISQ